jgi:hypothetical protein
MFIHLDRGDYVLLDCGQGADGSPNFTHPGFIRTMRVDGAPAGVAPPAANMTIRQVDFAFQLLTHPPQDAVLHITNAGAQPHEMDSLLLNWPHPPTSTAGPRPPPAAARPRNRRADRPVPQPVAWVPIHLQPGAYLVVSLFAEITKGGLPQAAEGMIGTFIL